MQNRQVQAAGQPERTAECATTTVTYLLNNLHCANCAAKIERAVGEMPQVETAVLTFATKKLEICSCGDELTLAQV